MYKILVADDEEKIRALIRKYAEFEGHTVTEASNGMEAVRLCAENDFDIIVMDVMMPELDGINALSKIREFSNVPVIFLTAKSEYTDKVLGLNLGADDYVTKPFNPVELIARVKSQLRRYTMLGSAPKHVDTIRIDGIELMCDTKKVTVDGEPVNLTPKEYEILKFLMMNPGVCFTPSEIYRKVWGEVPIGVDNAIAVHIRHIREKIEIDPASPRYLKVAWGRGYKFEKSVSE